MAQVLSFLEAVKNEYNSLPQDKRGEYLLEKIAQYSAHIGDWTRKKYQVQSSIREVKQSNTFDIDRIMAENINESSGKIENEALASKTVEFQDRHAANTVQKYSSMCAKAEQVINFCRRELREVEGQAHRVEGERLSRAACDSLVSWVRSKERADDLFESMIAAIETADNFNSKWHSDLQRLSGIDPIFSEVFGMSDFNAGFLRASRQDDVLRWICGLGTQGQTNPFRRSDDKPERLLRQKSYPLERDIFIERQSSDVAMGTATIEKSPLDEAARQLAEQAISQL